MGPGSSGGAAGWAPPPPLLVLTGGDPLRRPDIAELVRDGTDHGLSVSLTPSGTAAVTLDVLRALRDAGLARLAVSLDGASAEIHDGFRGVRGSYRHTLCIMERARSLGLALQVNTTVSRRTVGHLSAVASLVEAFDAVLWALFFLIPVGRAESSLALPSDTAEGVLHWAAALAEHVRFGIKTTEAPQFLRVRATRRRAALAARRPCEAPPEERPSERPGGQPAGQPAGRMDAIGRAVARTGRSVTDGNGVVFVDHVGQICPSGFLPVPAGNVRTDDLVHVYRETPPFRSLRDPARLGGRCGRCEWRERCGGSRARAFAATGDMLDEDPGCAYDPPARSRVGPAGRPSC